MECLAQIGVLAADDREPRRQLRVDETAGQSDQAARDPRAEDQQRGMDPLGDKIGIDENARADDAAHYGHGGAEKPELTRQLPVSGFRIHGLTNGALFNHEGHEGFRFQ